MIFELEEEKEQKQAEENPRWLVPLNAQAAEGSSQQGGTHTAFLRAFNTQGSHCCQFWLIYLSQGNRPSRTVK
jgi:hypothetical protein